MEIREVKPKVKLIAFTKTIDDNGPTSVVAASAKLCYSKSDAVTILEGSSKEKDSKFIANLVDLGHESPFEHAYYTFAIEGISRSCSHQIVRHRIASYSQQSQRYVDMSDIFSVVVPDNIKEDPVAYKAYMDSVRKDIDAYITIKNELVEKYNSYDDSKKKANIKKAIEDARYLLPNACETKMVMTMNARSLNNFFRERCCERAQSEIRDVAYQMLNEVVKVSPDLFVNSGPGCVRGHCPEGKMSCGNPKELLDEQVKQKQYIKELRNKK